MNILAIDQGTSATKAVVVSAEREILAAAEVPVHPVAAPDGGVEQDPEEIWSTVREAGRHAVARAAVPIGAVGLANQGETILAWDRATGTPLSAAISWQDRRSTTVCERLVSHVERLRSLTGLPLDPYFAAPKMTWLRENITRAGVCTTTDTWLLDGLRRRTRTLLGRCQGFYCAAAVTHLLVKATGQQVAAILGLEEHAAQTAVPSQQGLSILSRARP